MMKKLVVVILLLVLYPLPVAMGIAPRSIVQGRARLPWQPEDVAVVKKCLQDAAAEVSAIVEEKRLAEQIEAFRVFFREFRKTIDREGVSYEELDEMKEFPAICSLIGDIPPRVRAIYRSNDPQIKDKGDVRLSILYDIDDRCIKSMRGLRNAINTMIRLTSNEQVSAVNYELVEGFLNQIEYYLDMLEAVKSWKRIAREFLDSISIEKGYPKNIYRIMYYLQRLEDRQADQRDDIVEAV